MDAVRQRDREFAGTRHGKDRIDAIGSHSGQRREIAKPDLPTPFERGQDPDAIGGTDGMMARRPNRPCIACDRIGEDGRSRHEYDLHSSLDDRPDDAVDTDDQHSIGRMPHFESEAIVNVDLRWHHCVDRWVQSSLQ